MRVSANSPSLCPTMFSVTYTGACCLALCTAMVSPTKSGTVVEPGDQVELGRVAVEVLLADFARGQPELRVRALAREDLDVSAGRARELRALARHHFHAMHDGADRDIAQRQRIAGLDRRFRARHELRADGEPFGRHHVPALAIGVEQEGEMRAAVRVVFEALHLRRDAVLVAAEIDDAQVMLVATALVAHGDAAV